MKKNKKTEIITFRTSEDNREFLNDILDENSDFLNESMLMDAILEHYLQSGIVIMIVKEIKRSKEEKKNKK